MDVFFQCTKTNASGKKQGEKKGCRDKTDREAREAAGDSTRMVVLHMLAMAPGQGHTRKQIYLT